MAIGNPIEMGVPIGKSAVNRVFSIAMWLITGGYASWLHIIHTHDPFKTLSIAVPLHETDGFVISLGYGLSPCPPFVPGWHWFDQVRIS